MNNQIDQNPYIHRKAIKNPRHFFGRQLELREILAHTDAEQSVSIVGPRKIGKTSLLFQLNHEAQKSDSEKKHLYIYLDGQVKPNASKPEMYQWIWLETLISVGEQDNLHTTVQSAQEFEESISKLCAVGFKFIFLLDEFEVIATNPALDTDFFSHLRSLNNKFPVVYVTSSGKPLFDLHYIDHAVLSSPFFNIFHQQRLGFLTETETQQLILNPIENTDFYTFFQDKIRYLISLAGYHPAFLQIACYFLFESRRADSEFTDLTKSKIRKKYSDELEGHFRYIWNQLDTIEKDAMHSICKGQENEVEKPQWESLEHQCLIYDKKPFLPWCLEILCVGKM